MKAIKYEEVITRLALGIDCIKLSGFDLSSILSVIYNKDKEKILDDLIEIRIKYR